MSLACLSFGTVLLLRAVGLDLVYRVCTVGRICLRKATPVLGRSTCYVCMYVRIDGLLPALSHAGLRKLQTKQKIFITHIRFDIYFKLDIKHSKYICIFYRIYYGKLIINYLFNYQLFIVNQ